LLMPGAVGKNYLLQLSWFQASYLKWLFLYEMH
jgi:hypothetical protein